MSTRSTKEQKIAVLKTRECNICPTRILKAIFKLNGCINCHNGVYWAPTRRSQLMPTKTSQAFVLGAPFQVKGSLTPFFDGRVTAQSYLAMLQHQLLPLSPQQDESRESVLSAGWGTGPLCYACARLGGCQSAWSMDWQVMTA